MSNLPFLFKVLERVAFSRLSDYLQEHSLFDPLQSAYRKNHSVETLLVNLSNYILQEMDHGNITALVLLDLSSAFDTIDHSIIIHTLSSLGITGSALDWFRSYLSCHSQRVIINGVTSPPMSLTCGVPQGSVGGPTLFSIYLTRLQLFFRQYSVRYHIYADDIQIYVSFPPGRATQAINILESCLRDIDAFMLSNSLQLNHSKCEFMLFGSKPQLQKINIASISVCGKDVFVSESCRNLGVIFDSQNVNVKTQSQWPNTKSMSNHKNKSKYKVNVQPQKQV